MRTFVTGLGMFTSVGNDAASSCAATRAGIARPGPLAFTALDREGLSNDPVAGHPVHPLTRGFEGVAVHALLARYALRDLVRSAGLAELGAAEWAKTGIFVCVSPSRTDEPEPWDAELAYVLPRALAATAPLPVPPERITTMCAGHAGALLAARQAAAALEARELDRAIVLGVDSLVGEDEVAWLASDDRLKTPDQQVGLEPGQAAAALLLERERPRRGPGPAPLAVLCDVAAETAAPVRDGALESDGRAIARVVLAARAGTEGPLDVYGDANGETWRAQEWGTALVHLTRARAAEELALSLPAAVLGDTGAASGAIGVCLAVRAFVRGYARAPHALVLSRSEHGHVAAARVEPAANRS